MALHKPGEKECFKSEKNKVIKFKLGNSDPCVPIY